jgi:hypothetical protein
LVPVAKLQKERTAQRAQKRKTPRSAGRLLKKRGLIRFFAGEFVCNRQLCHITCRISLEAASA